MWKYCHILYLSCMISLRSTETLPWCHGKGYYFYKWNNFRRLCSLSWWMKPFLNDRWGGNRWGAALKEKNFLCQQGLFFNSSLQKIRRGVNIAKKVRKCFYTLKITRQRWQLRSVYFCRKLTKFSFPKSGLCEWLTHFHC